VGKSAKYISNLIFPTTLLLCNNLQIFIFCI